MQKVILICNSDGALAVFRGPLIKALIASGNVVITISPRSEYFEALEDMGARPVELVLSRHSVSILSNILFLIQLFKIIRHECPDVVHSFTHKGVVFGSLAARLSGVKTIVATVTGLGTLFIRTDFFSRFLRKMLIWQYRFLLPKRAKILFQNPDDKYEMERLKAVRSRQSILTCGSGIDLGEFAVPTSKMIKKAREILAKEIGVNIEEKIVVLLSARCVPEKGFYEFYDAAASLEEQFPGRYVFCHIGLVDGAVKWLADVDQVRNFASLKKVHYIGFKPNPRQYLIASDVITLPSYREGVPRSLIEGLALGKAIIATDTPGCRETVIAGRNGYLCPARDSDELANAIASIDDRFLTRSGAFSRQLCEEKFDVRKLNALTFSLYGLSLPAHSSSADS